MIVIESGSVIMDVIDIIRAADESRHIMELGNLIIDRKEEAGEPVDMEQIMFGIYDRLDAHLDTLGRLVFSDLKGQISIWVDREMDKVDQARKSG